MSVGVRRPGVPLVSVVMPVYNEGTTVGTVIEDLLTRNFPDFDIELIVVESNSLDSSREVVRRFEHQPGVKLILQEEALGKGFAVRRGFYEVSGEIILIQDADLEYTIDDYPALIKPIVDGRASVVLGVRPNSNGAMRVMPGEPWSSRITNFGHVLFTHIFNLLYGQHLQDPFTMYKVFRVECIQGLRFSAKRFDFDWELLGKLCRRGFEPLEVPVSYRSRGFRSGKKIRKVKDPVTWVVAAIKYRLCKL